MVLSFSQVRWRFLFLDIIFFFGFTFHTRRYSFLLVFNVLFCYVNKQKKLFFIAPFFSINEETKFVQHFEMKLNTLFCCPAGFMFWVKTTTSRLGESMERIVVQLGLTWLDWFGAYSDLLSLQYSAIAMALVMFFNAGWIKIKK